MDKNAIIETLDYLFEKFGIAIDWTAENVMPYVQELAEKIVTCNIVSDAVVIFITALLIVGCCIYVRVLYGSYKCCKTTKKDTFLFTADYWHGCFEGVEANPICIVFSIIAMIIAPICIIIFCGFMESLLKWIFIPELQLMEYVGNFVNSCGV